MKKQQWIALLFTTVAIAVVGIAFLKLNQKPAEITLVPGTESVRFSIEKVGGGMIDLADYKGKVVVVDFWATWCPPCIASVPDLNALHTELEPKGFTVIGVSLDEDRGLVEPFMKRFDVRYPVGFGSESVVRLFGGIEGIPTLFILDRNHNVMHKLVGYQEPAALKALIEPLL